MRIMDKFHIAIELLYQIPIKARKHLNLDASIIPYCIILTIMRATAKGESLSIKSLFLELPYSVMGVRYHFNRLVDCGWIELIDSDFDKRLKMVCPSEKLVKRIQSFMNDLNLN